LRQDERNVARSLLEAWDVAGHCNASQDAQDAWDPGDAWLASGRNAHGSDAGSVFADARLMLGGWATGSPPVCVSTTPHFVKRLAKAQAAFVAVKRLSPPGIGLSPFLCHRLASSLLFPILSYGADASLPTVHMTRKLSAFW